MKKYTIRTPFQLQTDGKSGEMKVRLVLTCEVCKTPVPLLDMLQIGWSPEREDAYVVCKKCTWTVEHSADAEKIRYTAEVDALLRHMIQAVDRRRAGKAAR